MDLSPDEENFQGRLLHQATLWDNLELLQELIVSGAEVDARDEHNRSALHAAALAERSCCLPVLCAAGADVNARCDDITGGKTPLHIAAECGHAENVSALLSAGADISVVTAAGDSALTLAERSRHRHAANVLRDARAANQVRSSYSEKRGVRRQQPECVRVCVAEDAYDAAQYFVEDVKDPWCEDALERERSSHHAQLRELVVRGDASGLRDKLDALGSNAAIIANLTPGGANTLLYVASELGNLAAASVLVGAGADGRAHPVTRYGPLYIACYHGHADIATLLLAHFPEAVQQETVEKWLPLHAACIGGHPSLVKLLLEYQYPTHLLTTYTDPSGQCQYRMAFDVNARDASGQSALYVACTLGNAAVVDALLEFSLPALAPAPAPSPPKETTQTEPRVNSSPHRSGISLGIHAIVNKLTGGNKTPAAEAERRVRPVRADGGRGPDSCVACAARLGHARVLRRLLAAGARADAAAEMVSEVARDPRRRSRSASAARGRGSPAPAQSPYSDDREGWTALAVAARARNVQIVEMLLVAGATDPGGKALRECARHGLTDLVASLLATKAYPDPEYKLNKSAISETVLSGKDADPALSFSARCPSTPVMINWRELRCQLARLRMSWLRAAASRVNSKLCSSGNALLALTRLELANNELRELPRELFSLISLRYLNVAQNKLERLPTVNDPFEEEYEGGRLRRKRGERRTCSVYTAPVLQELYLQDNRLEELPADLFSLPSLASLDVSNNKLRALPAAVWRAPALRDLNAALNHLKELPSGDETNNESASSASSPSESPLPGASPSTTSAPYGFSQSKSASRSPSIENSDVSPDDEDIPVLGNRAGNAVWSEARRAHAWRGARAPSPVRAPAGPGASCLASLNLSHNQFSCVPPPLACRAPALTRLNMAYNGLRSMSYVTSYPTNLRQLDLSHNEISCWPSLPQVDSFGGADGSPLACYCPTGGGGRARPRSGGSVRSQLLSAACPARRHLRLEALRTLILANNMLTRIQLTTDDDGLAPAADHRNNDDNDDEWSEGECHLKRRLLFPLLSMLDVSCNILRSVPPAIYLLSNLAVLNLSGNKDITDLPPQMGLLSRLWNLNTVGCSLSEPLRSVVRGGRSRSVDVVGFLRSVLHEAKPYARMKLMIVGVQGIGKTSLLECLRQESAVQHRRKPTDHWAKRMGNRSARGMSTVGVDIECWTFEPQRAARGPVTFSTWDFGGQHEYYSTHQYFLSRRSLYLVVWKVPDGKKGLASALQWLRSIQARAPGSPVIMVGTHYDQVNNSNLPESESPMALQRLIRGCVMGAPDADKLGLPRVLDTIEVSCNTRHNIKLLADIIYSVAFSVKPPGSKEPMLEQRVPATYLALEECVVSLATELKEPVLRHEQYRKLVTQYMQQKNLKMFRDAAELHQATMFLHENGVLLHYDDATLKELYFLRPQWLCDILAHVVTVREINPFASNGIMKVEDLAHVFKASPALGGGEEARSLGMSLLNKFELALCWDGRALLVPPLLPASEPVLPQPQLALKSRTWPGTPRRMFSNTLSACDEIRNSEAPLTQDCGWGVTLSCRDSGRSLRRILLMSYVPCGFWARLCARLLSDSALAGTAADLYRLPQEIEQDENLSKALELNWSWKVWKTGVKLVCGQLTLLSLREIPPTRDPLLGSLADEVDTEELYHHMRFRVRQEGVWCELDMQTSACIEILLPAQACVARRMDGLPLAGYQSITLEPNPAVLARVLALVSDLLDLLLEDWYPSLGTRFVHTSEGRCLITRMVPCPSCLRDAALLQHTVPHSAPHPDLHENNLAQALKRLELGNNEPRRLRLSEESRASDRDSGVGNESFSSSRLGSVEGVQRNSIVGECWTLEECILAGCTGKRLICHHHADIELADVAPDILLLDVEDAKRARWEHITLGAVVGRGAFGTVVAGTWKPPGAEPRRVALKALQPVPAQPQSIPALTAYKAAVSRWDREPLAAACRAYCGLRQELGILSRLRHAHVLPLLAASPAPLALLLAIAPQGSLESTLRGYRGCGARVGARAARALTLQLARALEYLHAHRVLYRDLKSENVLVWSFPAPAEARVAENSPDPIDVHVKLGDYGISRLAPPSGTKGFGGTEGFMAPEIMRYNGEEEYTEKVDCFSFGMLLYEIFTLRQPFEGHEAVKEAVLEGARPPLSPRDLQYPCSMLETMRRCWGGAPELRPSAAALVAVAAAPEFLSLRDAAVVRRVRAAASTPIANVTEENTEGWEIWYGGAEPERAHTLITSATTFHHHHSLTVPPDKTDPVIVTAMCRVGRAMWLGDSVGRVSVYSISDCALLWSVKVCEAVGGGGGGVAALLSLEALRRVALALSCGRLFLVSSERPQAESTFVLTELGTATELNCLAAVHTDNGVEVWAGGDGLHTYTLTAEGVAAAEAVPAPARPSRLAHLAASSHAPTVLAACKNDVYVYAYAAGSREQTARLDCSKLAPSSESLQSIASDDPLTEDRCRITSLCVCGTEAYVGTLWGCVVVADAATLRPLAVCRPHEGEVRSILPLYPHGNANYPMLATLGDGYRPLLNRYAPSQSGNTNTALSGYYCLLWRTQHWLPD